MTTPRDDIAGLCERLAKALNDGMEAAGTLPAKDSVKVRPRDWHKIIDTSREAATQLDSLLKEREALGERVKEMTSLLAISEDLRRKVIDVAEQWQARAEALQARVKELDRESEGYKRLYHDGTVDQLRAEKRRDEAESRALRAEQERDEAISALKPMAAVAVDIPEHWDNDHQCVTACGHFRRAEQAIRRLSAGPEKEG